MQTIRTSDARSQVLDVLGVSVEFLTLPSESAGLYCVIRGSIPPGMSVPLHSHRDPESFFVVSGHGQVLAPRGDRLEWMDVAPGDFFHIPGGAKHAHRNTSNQPVVELVTTGAPLGQFFLEVGRPIAPGVYLPPLTAEDLDRFQDLAAEYGHWLASPAENAAVGLSL